MTCPRCGAASRDDARFCGTCGAPASPTEPAPHPSADAPAIIGREIAGRYRVLAKLGEGGMGAVFRAEQISLKRTVAVKLLRPDVVSNAQLLRRFNAEAEAVAKLNHPNTVNIYDFGQDSDGTLFIAMEFIEGRSLRTVIQHEAPVPPRRALAIATQVAASLADAHAHAIVHRDLKPDNVMLQDRGRERDVARVLDFGIAKLRDDTRATQMQMTQQGDMLGTPQYMAPEQIRAGAIDGRTDVYALGCMLYEMVTARLPYEAPTVMALLSKHLLEHPLPPSQRRPELALPVALDALILGAMAKDPQARPATMELFGEQLAGLLAALPVDPRTDPRTAPRAAGAPFAAAPTPSPPATPAPPQLTPAPITGVPAHPGAPPAALPAHTPVAYAYTPYDPRVPPPVAPPPAPPAFRRPRSRRTAVLVVAGLAVAGVAIAAISGTRSNAPAPPPDDRGETRDPADDPWAPRTGSAQTPTPSTPDPWAGGAQTPAPSTPDPWAGGAPSGDSTVEIGGGVTLRVPAGFHTSVQNGLTVALDRRGVMIAAGEIDVPTDDPDELAEIHARRNHLKLDSMQSITVDGEQRPMAIFRGAFSGTLVRHVAVPLIGPGYRVFVIFQVPQRLATDPAVVSLFTELYTRRITLP